MNFSACLHPVGNRGVPPLDFLGELVRFGQTAPDEIFAPRKDDAGETDIYTSVLPVLGPWTGMPHRRAVMLEVLRVLGMFESSGRWQEDYDKSNPDENTPMKKSAGVFQESANSMYFGADLRALMAAHGVSDRDGDGFRALMMSDNHQVVIEYAARLLRHEIRSNGPVARGETHQYLRRDAVAEFQANFGAGDEPVSPAPVEPAPAPSGTLVDERSETNIATLHAKVQPLARQLVRDAASAGIKIIVTSGTRTYAEQDELFAQGRTKPGTIVTNARAGQSNHNFSVAFDSTVFVGSEPKWEGPEYKTVGALGEKLGLTWGGRWAAIEDEPHFELRPGWASAMNEGAMLAELRARHDSGADVFA